VILDTLFLFDQTGGSTMSNRYDDIISDMFKDAAGFSPSVEWLERFSAMTDSEQDSEVESLQKLMEFENEIELAREIAAIQNYEEELSKIADACHVGRQGAISLWVASLGDVNRDAGYVCYLTGLPYRMEFEFEPYV
jgi:hypothetical protein